MVKKVELNLFHYGVNRNYYVPTDLLEATQKEMRKEYTRMRDIANKRYKRLEASGIYDAQKLQEIKRKMPKLRDFTSEELKEKLPFMLSEISKLLNVEPTTIPQAREYQLKMKNKFTQTMARLYDNFDEGYKSKVSFSKFVGRIDESAFWQFVRYTSEVVNDNLFYWNAKRTKIMMNTQEVIDNINAFMFDEAYEYIKNNGEDTFTEKEEKDLKDLQKKFRKLARDVRAGKPSKQIKKDLKALGQKRKPERKVNRRKQWDRYYDKDEESNNNEE